MSNPLDKLTSIISRHMGKNPDDPDVLEAVVEVVMAIRDPSDEMMDAGSDRLSTLIEDAGWHRPVEEVRKAWQAMIDALLTEGEG